MPKIAFFQNFSQDLLCNFELEIWPKCSFLGTLRNQSIGWDMRRRFKYYGSYKTSIQGFLMAPWNYRSIKKCWCPHPYWNSEFNPSKKDVPTTNRGWRLGTQASKLRQKVEHSKFLGNETLKTIGFSRNNLNVAFRRGPSSKLAFVLPIFDFGPKPPKSALKWP